MFTAKIVYSSFRWISPPWESKFHKRPDNIDRKLIRFD